MVALFNPRSVVEVGAGNGVTAAHIVRTLTELDAGGIYIGYERDAAEAATCRLRLRGFPPERWRIDHADFFQAYEGAPVDFAFIDHEPKSAYLDAYERLRFTERAVVVAHDLYWRSGREHVLRLWERMKQDGWQTLGLTPERGFLVGVRG
jgi:predicted O-methyltransferase YrrM